MTQRIPLPPYPNGWYKVCYADEVKAGEAKPAHLPSQPLLRTLRCSIKGGDKMLVAAATVATMCSHEFGASALEIG